MKRLAIFFACYYGSAVVVGVAIAIQQVIGG